MKFLLSEENIAASFATAALARNATYLVFVFRIVLERSRVNSNFSRFPELVSQNRSHVFVRHVENCIDHGAWNYLLENLVSAT